MSAAMFLLRRSYLFQFILLTITFKNLQSKLDELQDVTEDENWTKDLQRSSQANVGNTFQSSRESTTMMQFGDQSVTAGQKSTLILTVYATIEPGLGFDYLIERDPCFNLGKCERVSSPFVLEVTKYCQCDEDCPMYDDCCADFERHHNQSKKSPYTACVPIQSGKYNTEFFGIFVIAKCPESYPDMKTKHNCIKDLTEVGPYVTDINGTVYKNIYCAMCHGISDYEHFKVQIVNVNTDHISTQYQNITQMELLSLYLSHPDAIYKFIPPNGTVIRRCAVYDDLSDEETDECKQYDVNPVLSFIENGKINLYRNAFCKKQDNDTGIVGCYDGLVTRLAFQTIFALTAMFSFSSDQKGICQYEEDQVNNVCVAQPQLTDYKQMIFFKLLTSEVLDKTFIRQLLFSLMASINVDDKVFVSNIDCINGSNSGNGTLLHCHMSVNFYTYMTSNDLLHLRQQMEKFKWNSVIQYSNTSINVEAEYYYHRSLEHYIFNYGFSIVNRFELVIFENMFKKDLSFYRVYKNVSSYICSDIFVRMTWFDGSLFIENIRCTNVVNYNTYISIEKLQAVITYVGNSVSVLALLLSITISRKLQMSDSISGKNLENLSITLALSSLVFMVGIGANDFQRVCYVFGIILHYLWLVSFSFMTIAVIFVCCNLFAMTSSVNSPRTYSKRTKNILTCIGLFLPLLFVLPAVVLDFLDIPMFDAMYAGTICFPTGFLTNVVFVTGPITLCIFVNIITLSLVVFFLLQHNLKMNQIRKSQSFNQGVVYLRISAFAGITWIFAIVGAFVQSSYVDFIAIVLCSLQGLAVALGNLTTRRICISVKAWHEKRSTSHFESTSVYN